MYDCIIVGAGPAGVSAAIYLKRAGFNVLIIEKNKVGGLIVNANRIENYLSYKSISGQKFVKLMINQLSFHNINIIYDEILNIDFENHFKLYSQSTEYLAKYVLVATGSIPKKLDLTFDDKLENSKIFYSVSEFNSSGKNVAVIGGGDIAFDYALNLYGKGNNVTILSRSKPKCLDLLLKKAIEIEIPILENIIINKINFKKDKLLLYTNTKILKFEFLFVAIGRIENKPMLNFSQNEKCHLIGDLNNMKFRQVSIATGDAIKKAMIIENLLKHK